MKRAILLGAAAFSLATVDAIADDRRGGWYGRDDDRRRGTYRNDDWRNRDRYGNDDWRNRDRYGNEDWRNQDRYGSRGGVFGNRNGVGAVSQTLSDLRRAASRNRVDSHEREHFNRAMHELEAFQYSYSSGRFEEGRLERAIDDLEDLSQADQVHPSDRRILARDLQQLRYLRQSGGAYARRY